MATFNVIYKVMHKYEIEVDAIDKYEALEKAEKIWIDVDIEEMDFGGEETEIEKVIRNGDTVKYIKLTEE